MRLLLFLFPVILFSQGDDLGRKINFYFNSSIDGGARQVSSRFISRYFQGGIISNEIKNSFFNKLENSNTAGALLDLDFVIRKYRNSDNSQILRSYYSFSLESFSFFEAQFTKDLFGLYFYGNQKYENLEADLSNMSFNQLSFQSIKLGLFQKIGRIGVGAKIAYVLGQGEIQLKSYESSLFTAKYGTYLDLNLMAKGRTTDLDNYHFFSHQGLGFAVDLELVLNYQDKSFIKAEINRLGSLKWNDYLKEHSIDTSYRFEGIEVSSLLDSFVFDLKSPLEFKKDLVKTSSVINRRIKLPSQYTLQIHHHFIKDILWLNSRVNFVTTENYNASLQCDLNLKLIRFMYLGLSAGIGGYSKWNSGMTAGINLWNRIRLDVKANSMFNIINMDKPASLIGSVNFVLGI